MATASLTELGDEGTPPFRNHRIDVAIVTQKGGDKSTEQGVGRPIRTKTVPKETFGGDPATGQHGHLD